MLRDKNSRADIMRYARTEVVRKLAGWIFRRSQSRHKTAERFGINPTGILEFSETAPVSFSRGGGKIYARNVGGGKTSIFIGGVPFIQKAFRSLNIVPKRASALTIPLHADAARTPAREIEMKGWHTFIPKGRGVIMGKKGKRGRAVPLYALRNSVKIPRDAQLLPSNYLMNLWTNKAIREGMLQNGYGT